MNIPEEFINKMKSLTHLEDAIDIKPLRDACENVKGRTPTIINRLTFRYQGQITNEKILLMYPHEFENPLLPEHYIIPSTFGIGPKTFLAIEDYLLAMDLIDKSLYRKCMEKKSNARKYLS